MTAPMMADMPTANPTTTSHNGRHPTPDTTPPQPPADPALVARRAQARAERLRLIQTQGRFVHWVLRLVYVMAALVAGVGQSTGLMAQLALPVLIALLFVVTTEGCAIAFASMAAYRRKLGENAYVSYAIATGLSGLAIVVNWWGHHAINPFLAYFYAAFSAVGYLTFVLETAFARRDALWLQNKLDDPPPLYGLWLEIRQPKLVARAKQLATADPGLGRAGSLEAARKSLDADARRAAMQRIVRGDLARVLGADNADLMTSVIDPDQLADEITARAELGRLAEIYARRIDPQQIEEAHAIERASRRRGLFAGRRAARVVVPNQPSAAPAGQATTAPRAATPPRSRGRQVEAKRERVPAAVLLARSDALKEANPDMSWNAIARELGVSGTRLGTVRREAGRTN